MTSPFGIAALHDVVALDAHPLVQRYEGRLDGHDQPVLIEVISDGAACSRALVESHPALLETLAIGETEAGECTVVWPRGETLAERLADLGALPWHRAADLVAGLADAADHAHERGMFHGAIDPTAVQFGTDHQARLAGFGLARLRVHATDDGEVGAAFAADPRFTAPEVAATGGATRAGDIYSLGALLEAAVTGEATADAAQLAEDAPAPVVAVVQRATAIDPADRFESAADLAAALRTARDRALYADDDELDDDEGSDDLDDELDVSDTAGDGREETTDAFIATVPGADDRATHGAVTYLDLSDDLTGRPGPDTNGAAHGAITYLDLSDDLAAERPSPEPVLDSAEEPACEPVMDAAAEVVTDAVAAGDEPPSDAAEPIDGGEADAPDPEPSSTFVLPPLDDGNWFSADQNTDWVESVAAVVEDEVRSEPLDDVDADLLPGLDDADGRMVITLADAERDAEQVKTSGPDEWVALPELVVADQPPRTETEPGSVITIADAEQAVVTTVAPETTPVPTVGQPVLTIETGRVELDDPIDGDVLVMGGQLVIRAEVRGSVTVDGGRAVVFAPVRGDVINVGGTVSIEAPVGGRIRGQREFTTVRPGSQVH